MDNDPNLLGTTLMELILEAGNCNDDNIYAVKVIEEVSRLRDLAPDGLDVILKVQMYQPETISTPTAPRYDNTSGTAKNQRELFHMALGYDDWRRIKREADNLGVPMFASVFDHQAVEAAVDMGMDRLKIASGDVTYLELIQHADQAMQRVGGTLYISTGASDYDDLADLAPVLGDWPRVNKPVLMACHLAYPTPIEHANIARVAELRHATNGRYPIGYSDHTEGYREVLPLLIGLGAHCWEKHFTLTPNMGGDHDFAMYPAEVVEMFVEWEKLMSVWGSPNLTPTEAEQPARELARRGLYAKVHITKGDTFTHGNVAVLRPARDARPANELGMVLGKEAKKSYVQGEAI